VIVVLPNTSRESMSGGTRIVLEGRDAYGKMIVAETPLARIIREAPACVVLYDSFGENVLASVL
jgi:hypothetical protein